MPLGSARFSPLLVALVAAACAPSTFDGLTGGDDGRKKFTDPHANGQTEEEKIKALKDNDPRPLSPFSGSWVNTARPEFTWKLEPGITETTLELAKTRDFKDAMTFPAAGSKTTVDRDLEPGVYFWRLQARSEKVKSGTYGPIWSVLVRGASKNATKDNKAAHGGFTDADGNGVPDLTITYTTGERLGPPDSPLVDLPAIVTLIGSGAAGQPITFDPFNGRTAWYSDAATDAPAIAAGVDLDGDGYGDIVCADVWTASTPSSDYYGTGGMMFPLWGGPYLDEAAMPPPATGDDDDAEGSFDDAPPTILTQPFTKPPALAVGDFNGDGYGDVSAMFTDLGTMIQGNAAGMSFTLMPFDSPGATPPPSLFVSAGDFDGDGISDFAYTPYDLVSPLRLTKGSLKSFNAEPNLTVGSDIAPPTRATAITTGDFDGDGFDEVAFSTTVGGKAAICVSALGGTSINAHACWISDAPVAGFGATLGAGDTDGDGVDEIFVGSTTGITILTHAGVGYADSTSTFTPTTVTGPYSSHFSVFYPGRPGKAQWAVYGTDNKTLFVIEGKGEAGAAQHYDLSTLKQAKNYENVEFRRFGTSIR